jgi:DNA-binding response OmpR family regulator
LSRVFVVEDEAHLAEGLRFNLEAEGHSVELASDGETALDRLIGKRREPFDAVVLDVMLPGRDGFSVVSELRKSRNYVPVLVLTARSRPEDVLEGFAAGADDYLPKPFELPIFLARLQGLLRRTEWLRGSAKQVNQKTAASSAAETTTKSRATSIARSSTPSANEQESADSEVFAFNGKFIDFGTLELRANGNTIQLTLMEAKLLRHLIRSIGKIVSRKSILQDVWGLHEDADTRAIDNFIVRLRRYLEKDPSKPRYLLTVRGLGYRFVA